MFFRWLADAAEHQKFIDKLTKVKDAMGEWGKLLRELKAVRDTKYCRALFLANEMRNTISCGGQKQGLQNDSC